MSWKRLDDKNCHFLFPHLVWSSAVLWGMYLWTPNFLSFSLIIPTCTLKIFFSNFSQLLWENWPQTSKNKKNLVPKNEMMIFYFFLEIKPQISFQNWMTIFLRISLPGPRLAHQKVDQVRVKVFLRSWYNAILNSFLINVN